jgi:hypothetical protein
MGYETKCPVRVTDAAGTVREASAATVLLETDELIVRGDARIKIPRASIQRFASRAGVLTITAPHATVAMTLGGDAASKWLARIREAPKRLIDKLDVRPNAKVRLVSVDDQILISQLAERTANVFRCGATACDVVFVGVDTTADLDRLDRATKSMATNGCIWVIHRKGPSGIADTVIFGRAVTLGLAYTKVARVSDTHTAEKLVRPVAARGKLGR